MSREDRTVLIEHDREELPLLEGRYRLLERIGSGGVAEVWRAIDERLDRDVAVKLLREGTDDAFRRRFADEARRAAAISHPNVVTVYDAHADGEAFIVMELVHGRTLDDLVRERGPLSLAAVISVVEQIAAALDAAHARGIVHCDVKPANVVVDDEGHAKLADFGIARATASAPDRELVGTPRYLAPELVQGGAPTPRSDVFGLGLVAYELLAGTSPFSGTDTQQLLRERLTSGPPPLRSVRLGIPTRVDAAIARALDRDPERRYASAGAFSRALSESAPAAGLVGIPTQAAAPRAASRPLVDRRALLALIAALVIGIGLVAFFRAFGVAGAAVEVPDVRGKTFDEAAAIVRARGLDPRREDRAARDRLGTVLEQSPGPMTQLGHGQAVTLFVAARPKAPNVVGRNLSDAANALRQAGFATSVGWVVDPRAKGAPQTVVRQEPPAGAEFTLGQNATVYIVGPGPGNGKGEKKDDD